MSRSGNHIKLNNIIGKIAPAIPASCPRVFKDNNPGLLTTHGTQGLSATLSNYFD